MHEPDKQLHVTMAHLAEPPDGIIITISQGMLKEKGLRNCLRNFLDAMGKEDWTYWMRQGAKPKLADYLLYVYLCIGGRVRYRAYFVEAVGPKEMTFADGNSPMYAKVWIVMTGPVVRAPYDIPMKGFRGFRYTKTLF